MTQPPEIHAPRTDTERLEDDLLHDLATIRRCWDRMRVSSAASGGSASSDPVSGLDRLVSLRYDVQLVLNGWCRVVMEDRPVTNPASLPAGTDVLAMVTFLERHARWMSGHEAAQDCAGEVRDRALQVRAIAEPRQREWMPLGSCPLEVEFDGERAVCGGTVKAWPAGIARVSPTGGVLVESREPTCDRCGTEAVIGWWEKTMFPEAADHALVTADELTTIMHRTMGRVIKPSTLRQWIRRGWIESAGTDAQGRTLYDRGAVAYALTRRE